MSLERDLRQLLLARAPAPVHGLDARAQQIYRRQVRKSLLSGARMGVPITRALLTPQGLDELLDRWLDAAPPTTRLYWRLSLDFAAWVAQLPDPPHPALAELVHWETLEIDVLNAPDPDPAQPLQAELRPDLGAQLDPSARLAIYQHPVFHISEDHPAWPEPSPQPSFVIAWRQHERLRWKIASPDLAQLLAQLANGASLQQSLDFLAQLYGPQLDADRLLRDLGQLQQRGVLLGAVPAE
jgi:hypothetical protein